MIHRKAVIGILVLLLLALVWEFRTDVLLYNPVATAVKDDDLQAEAEKEKESFESAWGPEILDRDLFSSVRGHVPEQRPVDASAMLDAQPSEPEVPPAPMPIIKLSGIINSPDGQWVAYIQVGDAPSVGVRKGDMVNNVLVSEVLQRRVVLIWNTQRVELALTNRSILKR